MRTIVIFFMLGFVACGPSARLKTIRTTYDATNIAADRLATFSVEHELRLVSEATSDPVLGSQLASWREKLDHAEKVIGAVYHAIATAALVNDDRSVGALLRAAAILSAELHALGVTP